LTRNTATNNAGNYSFPSLLPGIYNVKAEMAGFQAEIRSKVELQVQQTALGGPIRIPKLFNGRNRVFFMSNYQGFRLRNQTQVVYSTPPAPMRNGDFSQVLPGVKITDPLNNNQPFPGNIIPSTRFDKAAVGLLEFYPEPNIPGASLVNNYLALQNHTNDKDQFTQRIDFAESSNSNWFGRYSWQSEYQVDPALKLNGHTLPVTVDQAMISNTASSSPRW
jgi:hypothetical protein